MQHKSKWYFVTKIVLTYCKKKNCCSDREKQQWVEKNVKGSLLLCSRKKFSNFFYYISTYYDIKLQLYFSIIHTFNLDQIIILQLLSCVIWKTIWCKNTLKYKCTSFFTLCIISQVKLKVSKSQKIFFKFHCPKNKQNIRPNSALESKKWFIKKIKAHY